MARRRNVECSQLWVGEASKGESKANPTTFAKSGRSGCQEKCGVEAQLMRFQRGTRILLTSGIQAKNQAAFCPGTDDLMEAD